MKMQSKKTFLCLTCILLSCCIQSMDQSSEPDNKTSQQEELASTCLQDIDTHFHSLTSSFTNKKSGAGTIQTSYYSARLNNGNWITASENRRLATAKKSEIITYLVFYTVKQSQENDHTPQGFTKAPIEGFCRYIDDEHAFIIFKKLESFKKRQAYSQDQKEKGS